MAFDLSNYETVEDRLIRFWADHPNGRISTSLIAQDGDQVIFRAEVFFEFIDTWPKATGYAEEVRGSSPVNKTAHIENCETSSIGRALANAGYATHGKRPSREEMSKVSRTGSSSKDETHASSSGQFATPKQIGFLKALARGKELNDLDLLEFIHGTLGVQDVVLETLTGAQASTVIDRLK
jgi:hypothetical protein